MKTITTKLETYSVDEVNSILLTIERILEQQASSNGNFSANVASSGVKKNFNRQNYGVLMSVEPNYSNSRGNSCGNKTLEVVDIEAEEVLVEIIMVSHNVNCVVDLGTLSWNAITDLIRVFKVLVQARI